MPATITPEPSSFAHSDRHSEAIRIASQMFHQEPEWTTFFREILGIDGLVKRLFQSKEELTAFEKTTEYAEIQQMLARLRERAGAEREPTRVVTLRLPQSLHESLRYEAHDRRVSLNQLCISKLLNVLNELAPEAEIETVESAAGNTARTVRRHKPR